MHNLLASAIALASAAHETQLDLSGAPYILHPLKVMTYVQRRGFSDVEMAAAVCHDVLEDAPEFEERLEEIARVNDCPRFSWMVRQLSKRPGETYDDFIGRVIDTGDVGLITIKLCDIKHNSKITRLKGITDKDFNRMAKYHRSYLRLVKALEQINV